MANNIDKNDVRPKLKSLMVSGYKSYSRQYDVPIELSDLNVIIGANGAGKSNLVSFLEMVSYISSGALGKFVIKNGFADSMLNFGTSSTDTIVGDLEFESGQSQDEYAFELGTSVAGGISIIQEKIRYTADNKPVPYEKVFKGNGSDSALLGRSDNTTKVILGFLQHLKVFHFNDTSINSKLRSPCYIYDDKYLRSDAGNLAAFLYRMKNTTDLVKYYNRIVNTIRDVFPRFDDFVLEPIEAQDTDTRILLNWREKGSDEVFGPYSLSDGTIRFMALSALLLQPEEEAPQIIILDEPEIGLHPYAVQRLSMMLRRASKYSQILIATQSEMLVDQFNLDCIMVADYDNALRSSVIKRLDADELKGWLEDYSLGELWEKNILGGNP